MLVRDARARSATLLFAIGTSACGARSGLLLANDRGTGGAGSGGSGGAEAPCAKLELVQPVLTVGSGPGALDGGLQLTASSDDGQQVTAVFGLAQQFPESTVHHASFAPWQSWPSSEALGPVHSTFVESAGSWIPARASNSRWAFSAKLPGGPAFIGPIDPYADGAGPGAPITLAGGQPVALVARAPGLGSPTHLSLTLVTPGLIRAQVVNEGGAAAPGVFLGCAGIQPPSAAAVPHAEGWLVAVATGEPFGTCSSTFSSPNRIDIVFVAPDGTPSLRASIPSEGVTSLQMAPHPEGAFIAWSREAPGISGARYSAASESIVGPVDLIADPTAFTDFALASTGDRLVFVYKPEWGSAIVVSFRDQELVPLATASFDPDDQWVASALGSPSGSSALVGCSAKAGPPAPGAARLARFDCLP